MPNGFNLFSFDFFEAFRRAQGDEATRDDDRDTVVSRAGDDQPGAEDDRRQAADRAFWGLGYFPVL
ncbi:hypothetical protein ASE36_19965 [Rhizobium sp. Root274]|uniref:hypothetical protein n=1 Tax=unclassified Rhizobium TaxID=2613769 RepID=UPI000712877C|nr:MULTISPECIES: hypothetical protein [unclassified Rhizobium]KQW27222.1 hypothetical protein ASC71_19455 [Rhizobium sp. Root1240]KRD26699.1 hypothetical protein ASE36_19965 [Rhizobium sp. Root274]